MHEYDPERSFRRRVGETASVISLRVPLSLAYAEADRVSRGLSVVLALLVGTLVAAQFWLYRQLLPRPVIAIRDKTMQLATDEDHLGQSVPMPFGKELGELAAAFNAMSVSLRNGRDHLEERVPQRTAEEALRQERNFAERLVQTAQTNVLVLDMEDRIVRFNSYMEQISGYSLEEMPQLLESSISKKVHLEKRLARALPAIGADPAQVPQVVMNLIINASEACGEDAVGQILVETGVKECGEEAFAEVHQIKGDVPVVLSSGYSESELGERFAEQGVAGFIQKPYLCESLAAVIAKAMDESRGP